MLRGSEKTRWNFFELIWPLSTPPTGSRGIRLRLLKSINMTREEQIEKRMNELEREYRESHGRENAAEVRGP
jgi:hypothetical protein